MCQVRCKNFNSHHAIERGIDCFQHDSHAAGADDARYFIPAQTSESVGVVRWSESIENVFNSDGLLNALVSDRRCRASDSTGVIELRRL